MAGRNRNSIEAKQVQVPVSRVNRRLGSQAAFLFCPLYKTLYKKGAHTLLALLLLGKKAGGAGGNRIHYRYWNG
jgi:hypothetical protein